MFVSAGVETVSRFAKGNADGFPDTQNPVFDVAQRRTEKRTAGSQAWVNPRTEGELPDVYIAMGQTAENVAQLNGTTVPSRTPSESGARTSPRRQSPTGSGNATSLL